MVTHIMKHPVLIEYINWFHLSDINHEYALIFKYTLLIANKI